MEPVNVKALNHHELLGFVRTLGEPDFRAKQIFAWIHGRAAATFAEMTDLSVALRAELAGLAYIGSLKTVTRLESKCDGTVKYLFELEDGNLVESVILSHDYGRSACVSSQVGCRMGCSFCASTLGGLVRDLEAWEMEDQVLAMGTPGATDASRRISSIVVMGSGEPLENLASLGDFIGRVSDPLGANVGARHITVSTCGLPTQMVEFTRAFPQVTLAVSLHAPNDELRGGLMPVNRLHPLRELMEACRLCVELGGRRITFEYALMDGVNDSAACARQLGAMLQGLLCHVNLIPLNPVAERGLASASRETVEKFQAVLASMGLPVTVRRELGRDIDAACGQLRRRVMNQHGL